jgi:hypothetical protein
MYQTSIGVFEIPMIGAPLARLARHQFAPDNLWFRNYLTGHATDLMVCEHCRSDVRFDEPGESGRDGRSSHGHD